MRYTSFEDLPIWQKGRELSKLIYEISEGGPLARDFKFRDQIRSSSGSVPDNIAEGFERGGNKEFIQFLYIAKGSCGEARSQSYRAFDNKYISASQLSKLLDLTKEISSEISNFIKYLRNSGLKGEKYNS